MGKKRTYNPVAEKLGARDRRISELERLLQQSQRQSNQRIRELERQLAESQRQLKEAKRTIRTVRTEAKDLKRSIELHGGSVIKPAKVIGRQVEEIRSKKLKQTQQTTQKVETIRPNEIKAYQEKKQEEEKQRSVGTAGPFDVFLGQHPKGVISALNKLAVRIPGFYEMYMQAVEKVYHGDIVSAISEFIQLYFESDGHRYDYNSDEYQISEYGVMSVLERFNILAEEKGVDFYVDINIVSNHAI